MNTAAPPTAMPAIAPVDSVGEELAEGVGVLVEVGVEVVTARVAVRAARLALRVK